MNLREQIINLSKADERYYSNVAIIVQTYTKKEQSELGMTYDINKHLTCDVRLVDDGSIVYNVLLNPVILTSTDEINDSTPESNTGNIKLTIPSKGSYVVISWLNRNQAFVALTTQTNSFYIGNSEGAYIDFFVRDKLRTIELVNADEFLVTFKDGKVFDIKTDVNTNLTELFIQLDKIHFKIISGASILMQDKQILNSVETGGKIDITNGTLHIKDILTEIVTNLETYLTTVQGVGTVINPNVFTNLTQVKLDISTLFK